MKQWFIIIVIVGLLICPAAYAQWDEYHEIEQNTPAYRSSVANSPYYDHPSNDVVYYVDSKGCKRYTTRAYAATYGVGRSRLRSTRLSQYYGSVWNPRSNTAGKRFYPNSNYKREVKVKRHRGLLSSVLGWLI